MKFISSLLLLLNLVLVFPSHAILGEKSTSVDTDRLQLKASSVQTEQKSSCYSIKILELDGAHVKEYINNSTDNVFMISSIGHKSPNLKQLMGENNFDEFQKGRDVSNKSSQRNLKKVGVNTNRLRVGINRQGRMHRSFMIMKKDIPTCVANPEDIL